MSPKSQLRHVGQERSHVQQRRVKMDAPVIDDGANAPNGGSVFKRRNAAAAAGYKHSVGFVRARQRPRRLSSGNRQADSGRLDHCSPDSLSSFHGAIETPQKDRTIVGLIFAKEPAERRAVTFTVPNHFFKIPAGAANHKVTAAYTFDRDVQLISYMPHMHLWGKDMKYEVDFPDGRR